MSSRRPSACAILLVSALLLAMTPPARAGSATLDVQAVAASEPGKTETTIPASLASHKALLQNTSFGTFADAGHQTLKLTDTHKSSAVLASYGVEVGLGRIGERKTRINVTIKVGDKPLGTPVEYRLVKGDSRSMEIGSKDAPTILIFTLKDSE